MNMKKPLLLAGAGTLVGVATLTGVVTAQASSQSGGDTLADRIAQRFNLDKTEVQKTINEVRADRKTQTEQKIEQRLSQAVDDGKITTEQKDEIMAKYRELRSYMASIKDKPIAQRRELMLQKKAELEQWAKDNGLTVYIQILQHGHGWRSHGAAGQ